MKASPILQAVYSETIKRFGEPDGSIRFDDPPPPDEHWPAYIDVLHWKDTEDLDIVTFATIGMSDKPMRGCDHRCELHFSLRAKADELNLMRISSFCANMALYPFMNATCFKWSELVSNPGTIPHFPNGVSVLLHPAFVQDGWDEMKFEGTKILIINLVPLTAREVAFRKKNGPFSIYDYVVENKIDLFKDRNI